MSDQRNWQVARLDDIERRDRDITVREHLVAVLIRNRAKDDCHSSRLDRHGRGINLCAHSEHRMPERAGVTPEPSVTLRVPGWRLTRSGLHGIEQVGPTDQPDAEHQSPEPEQQVRHGPQVARPNESGGH